jgi:hypothetical protein
MQSGTLITKRDGAQNSNAPLLMRLCVGVLGATSAMRADWDMSNTVPLQKQ